MNIQYLPDSTIRKVTLRDKNGDCVFVGQWGKMKDLGLSTIDDYLAYLSVEPESLKVGDTCECCLGDGSIETGQYYSGAYKTVYCSPCDGTGIIQDMDHYHRASRRYL